MSTVLQLELTISGDVQGVGYRWHAAEVARRLGLRGWVRNEPTGQVRLLAQGERAALEAILAWCRQGPPRARVEEILPIWSDPDADLPASFQIQHG